MQNTLAVISLKRIRENALAIQKFCGAGLIAVVKDDAYGHGAEEVAHALFGCVRMFAVSTVDEGASLRLAGITEDILVFTPPLSEEEIVRAAHYGLIVSITSFYVLKRALCAVERYKLLLRVHLAVNTGMNRYGFEVRRLREVCARAGALQVEGMYSHLYLPASEPDRRAQEELFEKAERIFRSYYPQGICHLPATGGVLAGVRTEPVRAGLALYGYLPEGLEGKLDVKPAMRLYATVVHNGKTVGRGFGYRIQKTPVAHTYTLRLGYGDGLFRDGGKLCMDACVREGVQRTGRRKQIFKEVTGYARAHNTTEYEVLVNIARRAEKKYDR